MVATPSDPGNAAQIRLIAQQLFDQWKAEQGRQPTSWQAWGGLILSVLGIVYMAGSLSGDVAVAKTQSTENRSTISGVDTRLSRIEGKIDMLMEDRKK